MTRILKLATVALALGVANGALAFVVGSPSMPSGWPADDVTPAPDNVTREAVPG